MQEKEGVTVPRTSIPAQASLANKVTAGHRFCPGVQLLAHAK